MREIALNVAVVFALIVCGGVFAAAEMSLVSLRDSQVQGLAARSRRGATVARLVADPNRFLSAGQIGVTFSGFLSASFGATTLAEEVTPLLVHAGFSESVAHILAVIVITVLVSYFSIVLSELTAKRLALANPEKFALALGPFVDYLAQLARPAIWLLGRSTNAAVRLLGGDPHVKRDEITDAELRDLVSSTSTLSIEERRIVGDVFDAGSRAIVEVMVPRPDVDFLDASMLVSEASAMVVRTRHHSRYPVIRGSADDVIGFVHVRDLFDPANPARPYLRTGDVARAIPMLPTTALILPALNQMRAQGAHMAVVVDEYGGTDGIVTVEDLVEELVGEIRDEFDPISVRPVLGPGGVVEVDGTLNLSDLEDVTSLELPDGPYETVAGFVIAQLGRLPAVGDEVESAGYRLRVTETERRRIARVQVTAPTPVDSGPPSAADPGVTSVEPGVERSAASGG